jgi:hypothetical protein
VRDSELLWVGQQGTTDHLGGKRVPRIPDCVDDHHADLRTGTRPSNGQREETFLLGTEVETVCPTVHQVFANNDPVTRRHVELIRLLRVVFLDDLFEKVNKKQV